MAETLNDDSDLQAEFERLKQRVREGLEAQLAQARQKIDQLESELSASISERARLSTELGESQRLAESLERRAVDAESKAAELESQADTRVSIEQETSMEDLEKLLSGATQDTLRQQMRQAEVKVNLLREQLKIEAQESARLALDVEQLRRQLAASGGTNAEEARELQRLAYEDPESGLPNRNLALRYLPQELAKAAQGLGSVALAIVKVERFERLEALFGEDVKREMLRHIAERLRGALRPDDVLARGGEDNFWVVVPVEKKGPLGMRNVAENAAKALMKFIEGLRSPIAAGAHKLHATVSCGLACSQGKESPETLIQQAELAVQGARNRVQLYQHEMERPAQRAASLAPRLQAAAAENQFAMRYQPIYELKTGQMIGFEGLLRWNQPGHGFTEPKDFLDVAISSGAIVEAGNFVMNEVCQLLKGSKGLFAAFNVSAQELMQADFLRRLTTAIQVAQLPKPDPIVVEVSEAHLAADQEKLFQVVRELRKWNISVALDDFCFSDISFTKLMKLDFNYIKLGPELIDNIEQPVNRKLVRMLAGAAESFGWRLIAENIETTVQLDHCVDYGCKLGQGLLLCGPVPPGDLKDQTKFQRPART